ncbi:MAG: hypothetical protein KDI19_05920, partial [Pseudomonadales bacterium]|nr:hypothetical protein [Pseudomonadales bacterium]
MRIVKVPSLKSAAELTNAFASLGYDIDANESPGALSLPYTGWHRPIGNRFAILPMEGWDAEADGRPSELVRRRWLNFARGGAKLLWGCEAAAVEPSVRANPRQLVINDATIDDIA